VEAGVPELLRRGGWIRLYRSDATLGKAAQELERDRQYGVAGAVLDAAGIAAVVAMGPWSDQIFRPLGHSIPLNVKRGYHLHLKPRGPVCRTCCR
jgi:glycine/D-amino acid oxidase-like deaminating enzyme